MRVLELYSGIGGMHYALRESGVQGEVVAAIDINTIANEVYTHNFPMTPIMNRNIQSISLKEIQKLKVDAILMSPPCQPFTRLGLQKDILDNRSDSLFYVLELIQQLNDLNYVLLENVKGFETSQARDKVITCLEKSGFDYAEFILSPCQFGVPNTRHRYYLLARRNFDQPLVTHCSLQHCLPEDIIKSIPMSIHRKLAEEDGAIDARTGRQCYKLSRILETSDQTTSLVPDNLLQKRISVLDIRTAEDNGSCCFTKSYGRYAEGSGSVFSSFSKVIISGKCREFMETEKCLESKLNLLTDLKVRYFTPKEVSRLMCFPDDFNFPPNITNKQRYRLLGNSINVYVVSILIFLLFSNKIV